MQLIRKPLSNSWYQRLWRALAGFYARSVQFLFGQPITWVSLALVAAAFFFPLVLGAAAGLIGGIPVFIFILALLFLFLTLRDYRAGALIAVVLLPLTATHLLPRELGGIKGMNPLNMVLVLSVMSLCMILAFSREKIIIPKLPKPFWVFVAVMTLAGLHGATSFGQIPPYFKLLDIIAFESPIGYLRDILLKPMIILAVAYMLAVAVANAKKSATYLIPLFFAALPLPLVVLAMVALSRVSLNTLGGANARGFLSVLGVHANELGLMFNMCFALAIFTVFYMRHLFGRLVLIGILGLLSVGVGLTFSRGAFLGYLMVVAYFLFTQRKFQLMLGVALIGMVGALFMPKAIVERATTGVKSGNVAAISAGRVSDIWLPLLPETLKSPLIGRGMSSVLWSDAARSRAILPVGHPHNAYLGLILDFGFGGAVFIFLFYRHMWQTFGRLGREHEDQIWRGYFQGARACIVLAAVQGMTDDRFTPTLPMVFLWLSYGLSLGLLARRQVYAVTPEAAANPAESAKSAQANQAGKAKTSTLRPRPARG